MIEIINLKNIGVFLLGSILYPFIMPFLNMQTDFIVDMKKELIESGLCIKIFTIYTDILHNGKETYNYYYENNILFRRMMVDSIEIYDNIHSIIYDYKLEPKTDKDYWININILNNKINIDEAKTEYVLNEKYYILENDNEKNTSLMYEHNTNIIKNIKKNDLISMLLIIKNKEKNHMIVNFGNEIDYMAEKSKVKFISIVYEDPLLNKKTDIVLNNNILYENNEILSSVFIKRYIDYNNVNIKYTPDYIIHIMDDNINMITLTKNNYIKLGKTNYEIIINK